MQLVDFPEGPVVKSQPANPGDMGSTLVRDWTHGN